jgi:GNAT superfamily N-acetyltransferase
MELRPATVDDTTAIAALHADSWRRHYRGSYPDAYLDREADAERLACWTERLSAPGPGDRTVVAVSGGRLAGFVHTILHDDPTWGALLDNLHVRHDLQGGGVGRDLMAASAAAVLAGEPVTGLYLWVLEPNVAAQRFYLRLGGGLRDSEPFETPGGGTAVGIRVVWPDAGVLLGARAADGSGAPDPSECA